MDGVVAHVYSLNKCTACRHNSGSVAGRIVRQFEGLAGDSVNELIQRKIDENVGRNAVGNFDLKFPVFEFGTFDFCRIIDKLNRAELGMLATG